MAKITVYMETFTITKYDWFVLAALTIIDERSL